MISDLHRAGCCSGLLQGRGGRSRQIFLALEFFWLNTSCLTDVVGSNLGLSAAAALPAGAASVTGCSWSPAQVQRAQTDSVLAGGL